LVDYFTQQTQASANSSVEAVAPMIGGLPTQALAFLAVFVYSTHATHATQVIAFEWKPGFTPGNWSDNIVVSVLPSLWRQQFDSQR